MERAPNKYRTNSLNSNPPSHFLSTAADKDAFLFCLFFSRHLRTPFDWLKFSPLVRKTILFSWLGPSLCRVCTFSSDCVGFLRVLIWFLPLVWVNAQLSLLFLFLFFFVTRKIPRARDSCSHVHQLNHIKMFSLCVVSR